MTWNNKINRNKKSNKLLLTYNIIDELNITTGEVKLINQQGSGYELSNLNDLYLVFNAVNSIPLVGGYNVSQKYYQKSFKKFNFE